MSAHHAAQIPFKDRAKAALADRSLKVAIERTTGTAERKRAVAVAAFAEFEAALASATSRPDSETRLSAVLSRAGACGAVPWCNQRLPCQFC